MGSIKKALIPTAGLGTRFLPITSSVPKEMLPIVDEPLLLHVVREVAMAGIEDVVLITGRRKTAIEDFFATSDPNIDGNWVFGNWESKPHLLD